ncbi:MAG: hypothetical protein IPO41_04125 [Acidobacteria bacterium]|nr:hypothetical protein [Acidobacteriota bacterium]MBK9527506.1 hypothetical protein [Acidobacteriota bacterium]MBP7474769.1 hypothetical protein [Pyrinomonadaceae bacterium]MBP9108876.1 hypothetical protein [Pyrinomonadaceae bacterium]
MLREEKRLQDFADAGEEKVAAMLGSLKRVDAPADFDFRVRARIAQGRPAEKRVSWFPTFARVAAPAVMLAAVGGYFGYNALYDTGTVNVPVVADSGPVAPAPLVVPTSNEVAPAPVPTTEVAAAKPPVNTEETVAGTPKKEPTTVAKKPETPEGGSVDMALREANRPGNVVSTGNSSPVIPTSTLSVREAFSAMGIRASLSASGWRVSSASGRAAAAGLKTGDIIETVNGKAVGANTVFDEKFSGSTLRVKRDGVAIQISL